MDGQMDVEMFMHLEVLMQIMMLNHLVGGIILLVMVLHLIVIGWQVLEWQEVGLEMTTLLVHYYGWDLELIIFYHFMSILMLVKSHTMYCFLQLVVLLLKTLQSPLIQEQKRYQLGNREHMIYHLMLGQVLELLFTSKQLIRDICSLTQWHWLLDNLMQLVLRYLHRA